MSILAWIIAASLLGGLLSVLFAAALALNARVSWVSTLVSYAIGALLGTAFLNILPEALELSRDPVRITTTVLFGILLFFILEKLVLWRHCHVEECEVHDPLPSQPATAPAHDHGRSGMMIMLGDTFHNFVDGIVIAATFLVDIQLGIVTTLAVAAHEIPQEIADFGLMLHKGLSRIRIILVNILSASAAFLGAIITYSFGNFLEAYLPIALAATAGFFIYIAASDLIPEIHYEKRKGVALAKTALLFLGVIVIWFSLELLS